MKNVIIVSIMLLSQSAMSQQQPADSTKTDKDTTTKRKPLSQLEQQKLWDKTQNSPNGKKPNLKLKPYEEKKSTYIYEDGRVTGGRTKIPVGKQ
jgi:hypothetical protein